jgi:cyclic pyranopterin phosphate synthase
VTAALLHGSFSKDVMNTELVDSYHRAHTYLRISVTDRCNLRCRYCMPREHMAFRPQEELLTFDEILRVAGIFAGMGVRKVRLTGGEPLVRKGLPLLVEQLANMEGIETVGLTTNGVLLKQYAAELKSAGLQALNISLDTLRQERFTAITKQDEFTAVSDGIAAALECGFTPLKLNIVVIKGVNDDELPDFVLLTKDSPVNVRFIEYMPFDSNHWSEAGFMPFSEMRDVISAEYDLLPMTGGDAHAVAKDFHVPGFRGNVSFITSISEHFCGGCNRVRLTADGTVKPCLFSKAETNLRGILRDGGSDARLESAIREAVGAKWFSHPPGDTLCGLVNRSMIQIGG